MEPTSIIAKDYLKLVSNYDYEAVSEPSTYVYEDPPWVSDESFQYEVAATQYEVAATTSVTRDSTVGEAPSDDAQVYEDPGHNKEEIYSWFKEKNSQVLRRSEIQ